MDPEWARLSSAAGGLRDSSAGGTGTAGGRTGEPPTSRDNVIDTLLEAGFNGFAKFQANTEEMADSSCQLCRKAGVVRVFLQDVSKLGADDGDFIVNTGELFSLFNGTLLQIIQVTGIKAVGAGVLITGLGVAG